MITAIEVGLLKSIADNGLHFALFESGFVETSKDTDLLDAVRAYGTPLRGVELEEAGREALRTKLFSLLSEAVATDKLPDEGNVFGKILAEIP